MNSILWAVLLSATVISCSPAPVYVVLRSVPLNPSFTVIPANDVLYQVEFASSIEGFIIQSGVKVVRRPASKFIETKKDVGQAETAQQQVGVAQASETERYYSLEETDADYIVETFADSRQVKIIKKAGKEIVSTFTLPIGKSEEGFGTGNPGEIVNKALANLGIRVRSIE